MKEESLNIKILKTLRDKYDNKKVERFEAFVIDTCLLRYLGECKMYQGI
jgi:hypothetical protein